MCSKGGKFVRLEGCGRKVDEISRGWYSGRKAMDMVRRGRGSQGVTVTVRG